MAAPASTPRPPTTSNSHLLLTDHHGLGAGGGGGRETAPHILFITTLQIICLPRSLLQTTIGWEQAVEAGEKLRSLFDSDGTPYRVFFYTSPYLRCKQVRLAVTAW